MVTDVAGVRVGHWTDAEARTGCTVVLLPAGTVASVDVRGGAPASRELSLLEPHRTVQRCDAVLLTGGSAFGLAAADGVMRWCEERGIGVPTAAGPVPIVPTLALFDLAVGDPSVRPGPDEGFAACESATGGPLTLGPVGAGTGATVGKWRGPAGVKPGGLSGATRRSGALIVSALLAVNAFGDVDRDGSALSSAADRLESAGDGSTLGTEGTFANTTIGVVVTNAALDKTGCLIVAQGGHGGLSRSLVPAHTRVDGDGLVAAATGEVETDVDTVRVLAAAAVEDAVRHLG
jgi:L-aminopeptidase/D-esterase-like protein